jgi:hypothetical protein
VSPACLHGGGRHRSSGPAGHRPQGAHPWDGDPPSRSSTASLTLQAEDWDTELDSLQDYLNDPAIVRAFASHGIRWDDDGEQNDADAGVLALIAEIVSRLADATDGGEYRAVGLIGDLANGRITVGEARAELSGITFRHA